MNSVANTITIRGPIASVFDLVTSARFWDRWHPATRSVDGVVERPYQLGDAVHEQGLMAGQTFSVVWRVIEHARPKRVALDSENPRASILYTFAEEDGATTFTREVQYDPTLFDALGRPREAVQQFMHDQSEQALRQLKVLIETILTAESSSLPQAARIKLE